MVYKEAIVIVAATVGVVAVATTLAFQPGILFVYVCLACLAVARRKRFSGGARRGAVFAILTSGVARSRAIRSNTPRRASAWTLRMRRSASAFLYRMARAAVPSRFMSASPTSPN